MLVEHFARLRAEHRSAIFRHLMGLDRDGRLLRFGTPARDEAVAHYVASIDFERDIVEGVWDEGQLVGVAHLAVYMENAVPVGELGISVSPEARHTHLGQRLLSRVLLRARLMRLTRVYVQFMARNTPMARLAREFTNSVEVKRGVGCATIDLEGFGYAAA
jgi:RimJ/RimL family protein N-acetyltransferase